RLAAPARALVRDPVRRQHALADAVADGVPAHRSVPPRRISRRMTNRMPKQLPEAVLYHNPRCSKSRAALELLASRSVAPTIVRYLDEALIAAMAAHPRLIERPVFVRGRRAVIGRPPERVLELL